MKRAVIVHREPCPRCFERRLVGPEEREELARQHYWIGEMTAREGLPVDWHFVAVRMAQEHRNARIRQYRVTPGPEDAP